MNIVTSSELDLDEIARCHISAFPNSLSSKLGKSYCIKMLSFYLKDDRGIIFHIRNESQVIGYCGGLMHRKSGMHGSATSMTQYTFTELIKNIVIRPWLLVHPDIIKRIPFIWKNVKIKLCINHLNPEKARGNNAREAFIPSMGLVVIGVLPEFQGKGYGSVILREFERRALEKGFKRINLSVRRDNEKAISAYLKNGWSVGSTGKEELSMFKNL